MATIDSLVEATIVGDNDLLLIDQGGEGKKVKGSSLRSNIDHSKLTNRNAVGAHDQIYRRQFESVSDCVAYDGHALGLTYTVDDYYGGAAPNGSGVMFFKVVAAGTGTHDGGKYIDIHGGLYQLEQNFPQEGASIKQFGAKSDGVTDDTVPLQAAINYGNSLYLGGSQGGGGFNVEIPIGRTVYTGVKIKQGVNLIGSGSAQSLLLLKGVNSEGFRCAAADTGSFSQQLTRGTFKGFSMYSNESAPTNQIQWNIIGFSRWYTEDVLFEWFGGCTGISCVGSVLAGSGGPAQWYNTFLHCFLIRLASRPAGGIAANLGDTDITLEQITAMTWIGGRWSGSGSGIGLSLRGTGNKFLSVTFEGLSTACDIGSAGTRGATGNNFTGCYWEGNTINRNLRANAVNTSFVGSFITGGSDVDASPSTIYNESGKYRGYQANSATQKWEVLTENPATTRPVFRSGNTVPAFDLTNSAGTELTFNNGAATSPTTNYFRLLYNNFTNVLFSLGTAGLTIATDGIGSIGTASNRCSTIFATTGAINTSDERDKTELLDIDETEKAVAAELKIAIKKFKFKNSVELKGEGGARIHFGVGAQTVKSIFERHGLDPSNYALFCYDEWDDEFETLPEERDENGELLAEERIIQRREAGNRYGIRYEELLVFIMAGI